MFRPVRQFNNLVCEIQTDLIDSEDRMMFYYKKKLSDEIAALNLGTWNDKILLTMLNSAYETVDPLLILGDPGVGKTTFITQFAKTKAKEEGRQFVLWNDVKTQTERDQIIADHKNYFIFVDVRLAQMQPEDFSIPNVAGTSKNEFLSNLSKTVSQAVTDKVKEGIVFYDALETVVIPSTVEQAKKKAKEESKTLVTWNDTTPAERGQVIRNPKKYLVFVDVQPHRLSSDLFRFSGSDDKFTRKLEEWVYLSVQKDVMGMVFFDEINQSSPGTLNVAMQFLNERRLGYYSVSENIRFVAAGNLPGQGHLRDLQANVMDRFARKGLFFIEPEAWAEWALKEGNIDPFVVAFVLHNPDSFFYQAFEFAGNTAIATPRTMEKLNNGIKVLDKIYDDLKAKKQKLGKAFQNVKGKDYRIIGKYTLDLEILAEATVGVNWARNFITFLTHTNKFDIERLNIDFDKFAQDALLDTKNSKETTSKETKTKLVYDAGKTHAFSGWFVDKVEEVYKDHPVDEITHETTAVNDPRFKSIARGFVLSVVKIPPEWSRILLHNMFDALGGKELFTLTFFKHAMAVLESDPSDKALIDKFVTRVKNMKTRDEEATEAAEKALEDAAK
jgi:DNA polymerase III delta prime subunit